MDFAQFFLILRARQRVLWITLVISVGLTLGGSLLFPKSFKATASVLLNFKGVDPVTGLTLPSQLMPGYTATQVDIISSKNVALRVVDSLKLAQSPAVIEQFNSATGGVGTARDWLAELLLKKLDIVPSKESSVIEISFKGNDPQFAAAIANAFADEYQKLSIQLKVEPMKKASIYFSEQIKRLRDDLEGAQARLSKYQQEHGIVSLDNRLDVESARLADLSSQLVMAQGQAMEASSRRQMAKSGDGESPDVANSSLIQSLKLNLGMAESKLAELSQRLSSNHPQYISAAAEVEKLRNDLRLQLTATSNSVGNNAQILQQREGAVRAAMAEQKAKVLELNRTRDEMNVMMKDVESAQRAFDAVSQRFAQTKVEGSSEQSDIAVLNPATPPAEASNPKVLLNTLLSIFFGTVLGLAFSLLAELLNPRVRSERDIASLNIPVLGTLDWNSPTRRRGKLASLLPNRLRLN